jgi:hypothetical protein
MQHLVIQFLIVENMQVVVELINLEQVQLLLVVAPEVQDLLVKE